MKGVLYIDGVDIYMAYGISVADVAYEDLVCLPDLKPIPFNDWHEKDGIDPDLSAPVIAAQNATIPFHLSGEYDKYKDFMLLLSDGAYHSFNFVDIGLKKDLRLVGCSEIKSICNLHSFSLTFSDDDPLKGYTYSSPSSDIVQLGDYLIDDIDVASYGIRILRGTIDSIKKAPDVKENLKRNISVSPGLIYDEGVVTYKSRTAEIRCFMRAANAEEFWKNRNALMYDLARPGSRTLTVTELGKEIPCYYKGCSVGCFFPDRGKFWFEFTLDLEFYKGVI